MKPCSFRQVDKPDPPIWIIVSLVGLIIALVPFILPNIPVSTDGFKHLMVARVLADYKNPFFHYVDYFNILWQPVPTVFGELFLAGLVTLFNPITALKACFIAYGFGLWISGRFYLKQLRQPLFAVLLFLPLLHSFYAFSGFFPFMGAIILYPFLTGVLIAFPSGHRRFIWLSLILIGLYGFHLVGAIIGCFTVLLFAIKRHQPYVFWDNLLSLVPCSGLILYYELTKPYDNTIPLFYGPLGQIKAYIGYNVWSLSSVATYCSLLMLFLFVGFVVWQVYKNRIIHYRLLVLSISLVIIGLFMPYQMGGAIVVGSRTLPFAFIAAVGACNWDTRFLRASMIMICAYLSVSSALNTVKALSVQSSYHEYLSGLTLVRLGSKVYPIIEDLSYKGNKYIQPFNGVDDLYNIYRGGTNPYVFAKPFVFTGGTLLSTKNLLGFGTKFSQNPQKIDYRSLMKEYDYVIYWGQRSPAKSAVAAVAPLIFENGLLSIYGKSQ